MKLLKKEMPNEFKPFELDLLVETEEEARLLYHIFNRIDLKDNILTDDYMNYRYDMEIANELTDRATKEFIGKHVDIYEKSN